MSPIGLVKKTFSEFSEDECTLRAAALSYYTIFALPPLLVLILMVVGAIWDPKDATTALTGQFSSMLGPDASKTIGDMIRSGDKLNGRGTLATVGAFIGLLIGATGALGQLQGALNRAWDVRVDPKRGLVKTLIKRFFSLGMILGVAFLMLVSLVISAALSSLGGAVTGLLPGGASETLLHVLELAFSFAMITVLFALMFRFIPDAEIEWRDVWAGAAGTAFLFTLGKFVIGLYLGRSHPGEAFGAASAMAVLLVWIYYSGIIVLLGAEFTQVLTEARGRHIEPSRGAIKVRSASDAEKMVLDPAEEEAARKKQDLEWLRAERARVRAKKKQSS